MNFSQSGKCVCGGGGVSSKDPKKFTVTFQFIQNFHAATFNGVPFWWLKKCEAGSERKEISSNQNYVDSSIHVDPF